VALHSPSLGCLSVDIMALVVSDFGWIKSDEKRKTDGENAAAARDELLEAVNEFAVEN
jgi:hypothetical protein